jgi:hypothetical protein
MSEKNNFFLLVFENVEKEEEHSQITQSNKKTYHFDISN